MATLRHIRRRIASVRSTQQITKAMKMVAAAKLRKAQNRLESTRPYAGEMAEVIGHLAAQLKRKKHPLIEQRRKQDQICFVLITADKGLCGSFNTNIIRRLDGEWEACTAPEKYLVTVGRKGNDFFRRRRFTIINHYMDVFKELEFKHAQTIASELIRLYTAKKADRILVVHSHFKSAAQHEVVVEQFLPIQPVIRDRERFPVGFIFEPNPMKILDEICPRHLDVQMWRMLLENNTSEFAARMTAMETATENAGDMIKELVLFYNKARQAAITKELNEIVGGAEALKG